MKKSLLYFSISILFLNCLFFLIGFGNDAEEVAIFMGGLMAIGTDPVIIVMAILIGTALVVKQSSLSVIYFILASVVGATVVHYMLGTTKLVVDIIRLDALLIIPSIIIIVASFFGPKSKATKKKIKYTELPIHKPLRIIILIFTAVMLWVILINEDRSVRYYKNKTIFSKYVSKYIIWNNVFADREIKWCMRTNELSPGLKIKNYDHSNKKHQKLRKEFLEQQKRDLCEFYPEEVLIKNPNSTRPWQHVLEPLSGYLNLASMMKNKKILNGEKFNFGPNQNQNKTVLDLVKKMSQYFSESEWVIKKNNTSIKESNLLKLNCIKAKNLLHWEPTLNFHDTAKFTSEWYKAYQSNYIK